MPGNIYAISAPDGHIAAVGIVQPLQKKFPPKFNHSPEHQPSVPPQIIDGTKKIRLTK